MKNIIRVKKNTKDYFVLYLRIFYKFFLVIFLVNLLCYMLENPSATWHNLNGLVIRENLYLSLNYLAIFCPVSLLILFLRGE